MRAQSIEFKWFFRVVLGVLLFLSTALFLWPARAETGAMDAPLPLTRPAEETDARAGAAGQLRGSTDFSVSNGQPFALISPTVAPASVPAPPVRREASRRMNLVVLGDSLGDGLWAGLYRALKADGRFNVIKRSKVSTGFVRRDYFDWNAEVERVLNEESVDIAVVMMGTNDRQVLVDDQGRRHRLRSTGWEAAYKERVDRFTRSLKDRGVLIYWVGLPVMRSPRFGGDMQYFNGIYAERAAANNVPFIPTWYELADDAGAYSAHGPDTNGRRRLLRADDGIHFTLSGYQVLASVVADDVIRDRDAGVLPGAAQVASVPAVREPAVVTPLPTNVTPPSSPVLTASRPTPVPVLRPGRADDWRWPRL